MKDVWLAYYSDLLICDHTPLMHGNISSHFTDDLLITIHVYRWL